MGWFSKREKLPELEIDSTTGLPKLPADWHFEVRGGTYGGHFQVWVYRTTQGVDEFLTYESVLDDKFYRVFNANEVTKERVLRAAKVAYLSAVENVKRAERAAEIVGSYPPKSIKDWS